MITGSSEQGHSYKFDLASYVFAVFSDTNSWILPEMIKLKISACRIYKSIFPVFVKHLYILLFFSLVAAPSVAQTRSSLSLGGGLTYPAAANYNTSWFTSLHWNLALGQNTSIDTHLDLAEIGVEDYPDAIGVENDNGIYQLGTGLRQYFLKDFFVNAGVSAAIVNDGEASIRVFPNAGIGYDLFLTKRHGIEISLKSDLIRNFDNHRHIAIFSLGAAYKFRYAAK